MKLNEGEGLKSSLSIRRQFQTQPHRKPSIIGLYYFKRGLRIIVAAHSRSTLQ